MQNPILAMLQPRSPSGGNNLLATIASVRNILRTGDPAQILQAEMQRNPALAQFVQQHKGQTVEELLREAGIDPALVSSLLR